jgi:hypothetical protein
MPGSQTVCDPILLAYPDGVTVTSCSEVVRDLVCVRCRPEVSGASCSQGARHLV